MYHVCSLAFDIREKQSEVLQVSVVTYNAEGLNPPRVNALLHRYDLPQKLVDCIFAGCIAHLELDNDFCY